MRLTEDIYLVGSAEFGLSNAYDCHVYLLDGGEEATLIDCGVGYDTGQIIRNIEKYIDIEIFLVVLEIFYASWYNTHVKFICIFKIVSVRE